jgi:predicted HAD superfamily Cof-like phosphohydrolase
MNSDAHFCPCDLETGQDHDEASFWPADIQDMHTKFKVNEVVGRLSNSQLHDYLKFRLDMVREEVDEAHTAFDKRDADGVVDALIDGIVFAIGTLDAFGVDAYTAWNRVHAANMSKNPGVKPGRPNPYGFPDLIKPEGWTAPSHLDNLGMIPRALFPRI